LTEGNSMELFRPFCTSIADINISNNFPIVSYCVRLRQVTIADLKLHFASHKGPSFGRGMASTNEDGERHPLSIHYVLSTHS